MSFTWENKEHIIMLAFHSRTFNGAKIHPCVGRQFMYPTLGGSRLRRGSAGEGVEEEEAGNGSGDLWCPCATVDGL